MAIPGLLDDIIPLILNHCKMDEIRTFAHLSTKTNNIVQNLDWEKYYSNRTINYNNQKIDVNFMMKHGKYLINIKDKNVIDRWFMLYDNIIKAIEIFEKASNPEIFLSVNLVNNFYIGRSFNKINIAHNDGTNFIESFSYKTLFDELIQIILTNNIILIDCFDWTD